MFTEKGILLETLCEDSENCDEVKLKKERQEVSAKKSRCKRIEGTKVSC